MLYLSRVYQKNVLYNNKSIGKVVDLIVGADLQVPSVSKILIRNKKSEIVVPEEQMKFVDGHWVIDVKEVTQLVRDERDFYLVEDLLDKQVIDINGKRLVRVNDVVLKKNGDLKIDGIDVGLSGIFRRIGLSFLTPNMKTITLPWSLIEAFDYQTGNIQLKLTQNKLNTFHPAEIAEILEEAGTKERAGLINALNIEQAADAIEEADEETQSAILEQVTSPKLKSIINRMRSSILADLIDTLNPFTSRQIFNTLEKEKAKRVKRLLIFADDEAGGLMDFFTYREKQDKTVEEVMAHLSEKKIQPEAIIVVDDEEKLLGTLNTKNLLNAELSAKLSELVKNKYFVYENTNFYEILKLFSSYNLRLLPVVDKDQRVIGGITIDSILEKIEDEEEVEDAL